MKDARLLFGTIIVSILLVLYVYSLGTAISLAYWGPNPVEELPEGISRTMATVGGLVSALVIAQLAVTKANEPLAGTSVFPGVGDWAVPLAKVVYVVMWIGMGFAAFVVGELWFPDKVPALTTFAEAWLGLAVAAGYAYFGIEPST
jgi:hypothetical protein